ncbi:MAG: PDZ domain-containing protein [Actinobacteria bacterium]|nr:PDZ domain-containing protein [Actinomycetota bacterium]
MTNPTELPGLPPLRRPPLSRRQQARRTIGIVALAVLAVAVVAANFVRVPYVIISPGDATPLTEDVVSVKGVETHEHSGELLFLTVRVSNRDPSVWRWLFAELDSDVTVTKKEAVIGCASYEANAELQNILMLESQDIAKTVALQRLGYDVVEQSSRVVITEVLCDGPSEGLLELGDELVAIESSPVSSLEDVRPLIQAHRPGETITVTVRRDHQEQDVDVRLGKEPRLPTPSSTTEPLPPRGSTLGIVSQQITEEQFPFVIDIDTQRVSGPSAGLAFTLAIIDDLTEGELTGGKRVAVTGSILPDGGVQPVGGVEQKTVAARRSGAALMLVPACPEPVPRNCEAVLARAHAEGMRVVIVETIDDALEALERFGGDPIPPRPTADVAT